MVKKIFITGGAGFIGSNLAARVIKEGGHPVVFDNLSRKGGESNIEWLKEQGEITFIKGDVRKASDLQDALAEHNDVEAVVHLAGQVAVTTSILDPREDFEINALGTLNVLEAIRLNDIKPLLVYSSTNKVYGGMEQVAIEENDERYYYKDYPNGVPESEVLDFHSPYGCSKGAADQYVRDYSRIYDIPSVVMRQSCIYGPRQFGIEDQGWVAWFIIAVILGKPISIFGDGKQVRDILHVDDLVSAYLQAIEKKDEVKGQIFNVGGGSNNTMSIWKEFGPMLEKLLGEKIPVTYGDWRQGDQPVYISDITKAKNELGWEPKITPEQGVASLYKWVAENKDMISKTIAG